MKNLALVILLIGCQALSQESITMTLNPVEIDQDLKIVLDFENISLDEVQFKGNSIKDKYYVLRLKEFKQGTLTTTQTLFDERGNKYFKVDSTFTAFRFMSKIDKDHLKLWIRSNRFGSKQSYFGINDNNGRYVVKDFLGSERSLKVPADSPFYVYAIITPNRSSNGSGSYCRVAQSKVNPEEFGREFDIPHYFLVEMEFVEAQSKG
ncbi:hypothetical protein ACXYMT_05080 [Salinimicrobium sp. CAU 1759]